MESSNAIARARKQVITFIVRLSSVDGRLTGVIERVRTGEKALVDGVENISHVIGRMIAADAAKRTAEPITAQDAKENEP